MPKENNLKKKAASAMVWTAFRKYAKTFVAFISGIILARLLTPYDYGCIGMLSVFMALAEAFIDGGFGSALIQKKRPTQEDYSTIFWWNIAMACALYAILYLCAPVIARFYKIDELSPVLRVQGLVLFFHAFNLVQKNQLRKNLNFKILAIVSVASSIISLVVTVYLAYKGFGVWALVAQNLVMSAIPAAVYWFYVKWRPKLVFSTQSFKELFNFGLFMFLTNLLNTFCQKLNTLLIGKLYPPATLGFYSKASKTEHLASTSISSVITQVTYPIYAEVQDDKVRMQNMIRRFSMTISFLTFPLMFVMILTAKPIFILLYSEKWLPSVPYFQILCLVGLSLCLRSVNTQTLAAIGKSKTMFYWALVKRAFGLVVMIGGLLLFGMIGFLIGVVIFNWSCFLINITLVSKYIGYNWKTQLLDIFPVTLVSLIAALVSYIGGSLLHLSMYPDAVVKVILYAIVYLGWAFMFKPEAYSYFLTTVPPKFRIWEKLGLKLV